MSEENLRARIEDLEDRIDRLEGYVQEHNDLEQSEEEDGDSDSEFAHLETRPNVKSIISDLEEDYPDGAPIKRVVDVLEDNGYSEDEAEDQIRQLRRFGEIYNPDTDRVRTV